MDEKVKDPNIRVANFLGYTFYPWNNTVGKTHGWQKSDYHPNYSKDADAYLCKHRSELCFSSNFNRTTLIFNKLRRLNFDFSINCKQGQYIFIIEGLQIVGPTIPYIVFEGVIKLLDKYGDNAWPEPKNKQPWDND